MKRSRFLFAALLPLTAFPSFVHADDAAPEPVHVLRPAIHAEREKAELCLEFDRDLGLSGAASRIAAALHLEEDGKPVTLARRSIAYSGNEICLSDLERRKNYRLVMEALSGKNGDKISHAYSLSFKVPGRPTSLALVNQGGRDGVNLWSADPLLNSINGAHVTVELFRIDDPAKMAEAWSQRSQTALAPSESLYFARHNGASVWKKDIVPDAVPDKSVTTKLDITADGAAAFPPGLYLIAATLPDDAAKDAADKSDADKNNPLTPVAAAWLLRSNLGLHVVRDGQNVTALTESADIPNAAAHIHLRLFDHDQKILAEADSDANGKALLAPHSDDAATVVGIDAKGNAAFADLGDEARAPDVDAPLLVADLASDQKIYAPRESVAVTLGLRDLHRRPQQLKGSIVQLLRPDRSFYDVRSVTMDANGSSKLSFTAPIEGGIWHLVWQNSAGQELAETDLRVSADAAAPVLSLTPDRTALAEGGDLGLVVRGRTAADAPAPYLAGHIMLSWRKDDHPFPAWKEYRFDDGRDVDPASKPMASFVTDSDGKAKLHLNIQPPEGATAFVRAELRAASDTPGETPDSPPVTLPLKSMGAVIGISPRMPGGSFPENSLAHFDIVALGPDGKAGPSEDMNYQVFEEGRGFEWYQDEGHWDYKPQQQRRRIGGAGLSFGDDGHASVEWPVASGAYRLDITDADGTLRARMDFNAGWNGGERQRADVAVLDLKASPATLQKGVAHKIAFTLPRAALVTASIADDHIRDVLHAIYPAGNNTITFTPAADWGDRVRIHVEARAADKDAAEGAGYWAGEALLAPSTEVAGPKPAAKTLAVPATFIAFTHSMAAAAQQALAPGQSFTPGDKNHAAKTDVAFVSPAPIGNLPVLLSSLTSAHPFATADLARWLVLLRLWREAIEASGLGTEAEFQATVEDGADRLLQRQNQDGGFPSLPDGSNSDLAATIAAVDALAVTDGPLAHLALDQAAGWLHRRLENTWFDEKERPLRAEAYASLAKAGKLDVASLHYFSDTSANKPLAPAPMAALSLAFGTIDDHAASNFWLDKATTAKDADQARGLEPYLLANPYFSSTGSEAALEKSAKHATDNPGDFAALDEALTSLRLFLDRAGTWRAGIGKDEKTLRGVFAMPFAEKNPIAIRNVSSDRTLYVSEAAFTKPALSSGIRRRIYSLDGQMVGGEPKHGVTYAVVLDGAWGDGQDAIVLHDDPQPVFSAVTCALAAPRNDGFLAWLAGQGLTPPKACEKSQSGVAVLLAREDGQNSWRTVYLARAVGSDAHRLHPPEAVTFNPED